MPLLQWLPVLISPRGHSLGLFCMWLYKVGIPALGGRAAVPSNAGKPAFDGCIKNGCRCLWPLWPLSFNGQDYAADAGRGGRGEFIPRWNYLGAVRVRVFE